MAMSLEDRKRIKRNVKLSIRQLGLLVKFASEEELTAIEMKLDPEYRKELQELKKQLNDAIIKE